MVTKTIKRSTNFILENEDGTVRIALNVDHAKGSFEIKSKSGGEFRFLNGTDKTYKKWRDVITLLSEAIDVAEREHNMSTQKED